jgi:F-type H+-transporting ATPase subunit b
LKRTALFVCLAVGMALPLFAGDQPASEWRELGWKWANFLILAGAIGYVIKKKAPAFFSARDAEIQKNIAAARKMKEEADAHMADVEKRLAGIDADIRALRESARAEAAAETERMRSETDLALAKIQAHAAMEIEAAVHSARMQLKIYAGQLATDLAREKVLARLTPQTQDKLVGLFVGGLDAEERQSGAAN